MTEKQFAAYKERFGYTDSWAIKVEGRIVDVAASTMKINRVLYDQPPSKEILVCHSGRYKKPNVKWIEVNWTVTAAKVADFVEKSEPVPHKAFRDSDRNFQSSASAYTDRSQELLPEWKIQRDLNALLTKILAAVAVVSVALPVFIHFSGKDTKAKSTAVVKIRENGPEAERSAPIPTPAPSPPSPEVRRPVSADTAGPSPRHRSRGISDGHSWLRASLQERRLYCSILAGNLQEEAPGMDGDYLFDAFSAFYDPAEPVTLNQESATMSALFTVAFRRGL